MFKITILKRPISYSGYHRYNYRSYLSMYTALVKRNYSVTMVLPMVEYLRNWPKVNNFKKLRGVIQGGGLYESF